jgi:hypothetical protein
MPADEEKQANAAPAKMQFSLGTLLLLPVVAGCALAVLFTKPPNVAATELFAIGFLSAATLTGGIVYGKGYTRAFCIGAIFPVIGLCFSYAQLWTTFLTMGTWDFSGHYFMLQCLSGGGWLAAVASGCLCMGIRRLSARTAAAEGAARRYAWGRAVFILLLVLTVLSGPIVGRIGISLGWWKADAPPPSPYYVAPAPTVFDPFSAPPSAAPSPRPGPSEADSSNANSATPLPAEPASPSKRVR